MDSAVTSLATSSLEDGLLGLYLALIAIPVMPIIGAWAAQLAGCGQTVQMQVVFFAYFSISGIRGDFDFSIGLLGAYMSVLSLVGTVLQCVEDPSDLLRDWEMMSGRELLKDSLP